MAQTTEEVDASRPLLELSSPRIRGRRRRSFRENLPLYLMLLPGFVGLLVFGVYPLYWLIIAFQDYDPLSGISGSPFVGLDNFRAVFETPGIWQVVRNTVLIAGGKLVFGLLASLVFALLLNEIRGGWFRRTIQSLSYLLHFLSWAIFGGILLQLLAYDGAVNRVLQAFGIPKVFWLGDPTVFPLAMIGTDVWKEFGFGAILLLAALTSISPSLYESAAVDGANRWQRMWHITLPGLRPILILLGTLSLGSILRAGFEQILTMYNPVVYSTGDIMDTYVYRTGLLGLQFSPAAVVGLLQSFVGFVLVVAAYSLARRFADYRIF